MTFRIGTGRRRFGVAVLLLVGLLGCAAKVPKEAVELSYIIGEDIGAIHESYRALVQTHFETLRSQATTFLEERWIPYYLADFIQNGDLVGLATDPNPTNVLTGVSVWVEVAMEEIASKRDELLDPISRDERALLDSVDVAFVRLGRANAVVTAHLSSIREVQEVQDQFLEAFHLRGIRDQINAALVAASDRAADAVKAIERAEGLVEEIDEKRREFKDKITGTEEQ